jgi:PAS domain S-box-containing protein
MLARAPAKGTVPLYIQLNPWLAPRLPSDSLMRMVIMHGDQKTATIERNIVAGFAAYTLIGGAVTLVGWLAYMPRLTDWPKSGIAMFPNAASAAVCVGVALLMTVSQRPWAVRASGAIGCFVALLGTATLFQHLSGINLGIDTVLVQPTWGNKAAMSPGRMGPPASICFTLLGTALLLRATGLPRARRVVPTLGIVVCALCVLSSMGYVLGADPLFAVARFTGIAMQTSTILLAAAFGLLTSVPECEPVRTLRANTTAGLLARRSLPLLIGLPFILGWLLDHGQRAGWFDAAMEMALLVLALVVIFSGLLWWWLGAVTMRERALRESEERLAGIIHSAMDAVIVVEETQHIVLFNPAAEQMFRCDAPSALGRPLDQFIPARFREADRGHVEKFGQTGTTSRRMGSLGALSGVRADGEEFPIEASISHMESGGKKLFTVILRDTTERKHAEEALHDAAKELARASRAKDEFLAALSHELRTPLTPVLMSAAALESDPALPSNVRDQLGMMRRNIELEARLIDDLLDITRISNGKLSLVQVPVDAHKLIEQTAEIVRSDGFAKEVQIGFRLDAPRHYVMADPARLQQVLWNLIKNALKFTPSGGCVTVTTYEDDEQRLVVSVEDTGIGIEQCDLARIFNAFEQIELPGQHRTQGLGLGLAISKAIVEMHDGTIQAESEGPGRGAIFRVTLATIAEPAAVEKAQFPDATTPRSLRLLVVDDHEPTLSILAELLTLDGHQVTSASSTREARNAVARADFDVLISDLGLPDGSGLDLMREFREERRIAGIALSGYGSEEDLRSSREAGFAAHLVKPVVVDQLRRTIRAVVDKQ